jgi:penicillin-binding protein 1C
VQVLHDLGLANAQAGLVGLGLANPRTVHQAGWALALGAHEVSLLALTNAYRTLANGGIHSAVQWTTLTPFKVNPSANLKAMAGANQVASAHGASVQVTAAQRRISPPNAALVANILADPAPRGRAFGEHNALNTSFPSFAKTGTSNGTRDNWALGSTARHTVGVWIGNFEGDAMQDVLGPAGAAIAWRTVMENLHRHP